MLSGRAASGHRILTTESNMTIDRFMDTKLTYVSKYAIFILKSSLATQIRYRHIV
jgi:hypothetical protein